MASQIFRNCLAGLLALLAVSFSAAAPDGTAWAEPAKSKAQAKSKTKPAAKTWRCGGENLLAGLKLNEPETYARLKAEAGSIENGEAVLWKIEREGTKPSFLLGTVHMSDPRVAVLSKPALEALAGADVIALEVADVSPAATSEAIAEARDLVLFTNGDRLDRLLSTESFEKVVSALEDAKLPGRMAHLFKPWVVSMIMTVPACERAQVSRGKPVLDMVVAQEARSRKIPVVGLETIDQQLKAAASVPMPEQVQILRAGLIYADRANDLMETVLQLYIGRNVAMTMPLQMHLAKEAGIDDVSMDGFRSELIDKRNRRMRTRALPLLAQGGAFIAVGALHLVGETGLVRLFRDAGYTLTPIE